MTLRSQLGQTTTQTEQINEINGYKSVAWSYIAYLTFDSLANARVANFDLHLRSGAAAARDYRISGALGAASSSFAR